MNLYYFFFFFLHFSFYVHFILFFLFFFPYFFFFFLFLLRVFFFFSKTWNSSPKEKIYFPAFGGNNRRIDAPEFKIFADDTKVFTHVLSDDDCCKLQKDLDNLSLWSDRWQLKFSVGKCGVMHYGLQPDPKSYSMSEKGKKQLGVLEEEDLGIKWPIPYIFQACCNGGK